MTNQSFNMLISGVGGQGVITLLQIVSQAAMAKGYDVKTSELHGLSQRGGSVIVHIRFDKEKVYSPMVPYTKANLIVALEHQEALSAAEFAGKDTVFLINQYRTPTLADSVSEDQVKNNLKKISKKVFFVPASIVCAKELKTNVVAGIFLLGQAASKGFIPFSVNDIKEAVKEMMPSKYCHLNIQALDLAKANQ